jgi:hypothetical protein
MGWHMICDQHSQGQGRRSWYSWYGHSRTIFWSKQINLEAKPYYQRKYFV